MWLIKPTRVQGREKTKRIAARGRWIERVFGFEYTPFEMHQIEEFNRAKNAKLVEISGFVSWIDRTKFLLLPTKTTNSIYFICKVTDGLDFPANHQYVYCKGRWKYDLAGQSAYKILVAENIASDEPDHSQFISDIKSSDFQGNLFENWSNIDSIQPDFLIRYFVSSPSLPNRVGGITVSLFSPPRELKIIRFLYNDLVMFIAPELLGSKKMIFDVPELKKSHRLLPFQWSEKTLDFEKITKNTEGFLSRKPDQGTVEQSIALLSKKHKPENFESLGLVNSDYPITVEEHAGRRRRNISPHTDLRMTQFLVAAHMNSPSIDLKTQDESLVYVRNEIQKFADTKKDLISQLLGPNKMLNLDFNGKPASILNLAIS